MRRIFFAQIPINETNDVGGGIGTDVACLRIKAGHHQNALNIVQIFSNVFANFFGFLNSSVKGRTVGQLHAHADNALVLVWDKAGGSRFYELPAAGNHGNQQDGREETETQSKFHELQIAERKTR